MSITIIPYSIGCEPSPSVPAELLVQDGWSTYLLFWAVSEAEPGAPLTDPGVAVVECESCLTTTFGYPNDEGLPEHPMYESGLRTATSTILEVTNSPWVARMTQQTRDSMQRIWGGRGLEATAPKRSTAHHFIVLLKEVTFECIATSLSIAHMAASFEDALKYVHSKLAEH